MLYNSLTLAEREKQKSLLSNRPVLKVKPSRKESHGKTTTNICTKPVRLRNEKCMVREKIMALSGIQKKKIGTILQNVKKKWEILKSCLPNVVYRVIQMMVWNVTIQYFLKPRVSKFLDHLLSTSKSAFIISSSSLVCPAVTPTLDPEFGSSFWSRTNLSLVMPQNKKWRSRMSRIILRLTQGVPGVWRNLENPLTPG